MAKVTQYTCIKSFHDAFTKGVVYEVTDYPNNIPTGIEFVDDLGDKHTITARIFDTIFKECK